MLIYNNVSGYYVYFRADGSVTVYGHGLQITSCNGVLYNDVYFC